MLPARLRGSSIYCSEFRTCGYGNACLVGFLVADFKGLVQYGHGFVNLLLRNDERRCNGQGVIPGNDIKTFFHGGSRYFSRHQGLSREFIGLDIEGCPGFSIFNDFKTPEVSFSPYIPHAIMSGGCFKKPFFDSPFEQLVLACYEALEA